jgi:phage recombination protein Bet
MANENLAKLEQQRKDKEELAKQERTTFTLDKISEMSGMAKEMIQVVQRTVAKNTTPAELAYFLEVSKSHGLNPIHKEVWCYKDTIGNLIVFTGRDGFLKKNKEMPTYLGMRSSEVMEFDEFEIDMVEGYVKHKITTNRGKEILGAYAIVSHEGKKDTIVWLSFEEYNLGQAKWKTAPKMMIKKCAQAQALKEAAGMTGIQVEEAWNVKDGIATTHRTEDVEMEVVDVEKERLLKLIQVAKTVEALDKLKNHCTTPDEIMAYDEKRKELTSIPA